MTIDGHTLLECICLMFETAEIRRVNRFRTSVGYCDLRRKCDGRYSVATWIKFGTRKVRHLNRALDRTSLPYVCFIVLYTRVFNWKVYKS